MIQITTSLDEFLFGMYESMALVL